jgi:hypothetical protein
MWKKLQRDLIIKKRILSLFFNIDELAEKKETPTERKRIGYKK